MSKLLNIFTTSITQEFAYRANFIMWRVRNVLSIFLVFFLWDIVFRDPSRILFGYDRGKIMTYVLGLVVVKALVLSARTVDVSGEISNGNIINLLLRPINIFKYWATRDISSKALNLLFAIFEAVFLYLILKLPFYLQTDPLLIFGFILSVVLAMAIFFCLMFIVTSITFWAPEMAWGAQFLITVVIVEFLSGSLFPLDIFPSGVQTFLNMTPFPYMIFFPLQIYLGNITGTALIKGIGISVAWTLMLFLFMKYIWGRGLKVYQAYGR